MECSPVASLWYLDAEMQPCQRGLMHNSSNKYNENLWIARLPPKATVHTKKVSISVLDEGKIN